MLHRNLFVCWDTIRVVLLEVMPDVRSVGVSIVEGLEYCQVLLSSTCMMGIK